MGKRMSEESEEEKNEAKAEPKFEIQGVYSFLDCLFVVDILILSAQKWLRRLGIKNAGIISMQQNLRGIRKHVSELKKYMRNLTLEVLGSSHLQEANRRHLVLWRVILRVLKEMRVFK